MTDSLYGQKDLAEFCEFVIASLFEVAPSSPSSTHRPAYGREGIDTPPYTPPLDGQPRKEPPVLVEFIAYALYRTRLPISIVHQSLLLLSRLKQRYPSARGTASSPHRLFLSSLMLSAKISMDDTYSNKSWTIVGSNFFALKEVNQMERELFAFLGWNVVVAKEELDEFVANAQNSYLQARQQQQKQAIQALQSESTKRRRHLEQEDSAREARHQQARNAARALLRPHTYRHQSPSPIRSQCSSASASPSMGSSASSSPYLSRAHSPMSHASIASHPYHVSGNHKHSSSAHYHSYTSCSSSATSSTLPSATHSPTSPASAPLSAGPQTPESEHMDVHPHINDSPDFPEAATYVSKAAKSAHSPLRASRQTTVSA